MRLPFFSTDETRRAAIPAGQRVYAIGDVHGRLDLLVRLIQKIADEEGQRATADTKIILLGDLIDRGPYAAECVEYLLHVSVGIAAIACLMGNHEAVFLDILHGRADLHDSGWLTFGGAETLQSYGFPDFARDLSGEDFKELAQRIIPKEHVEFIKSLPLYASAGDYLFVHAGLRPAVPLAEQDPEDLLWIRGEFLKSRRSHGQVVVHGHTTVAEPELFANRIGIDTGAWRTGRLTALCLEGSDRWLLQT
jgi:serine/threonine protein phosphatase 1